MLAVARLRVVLCDPVERKCSAFGKLPDVGKCIGREHVAAITDKLGKIGVAPRGFTFHATCLTHTTRSITGRNSQFTPHLCACRFAAKCGNTLATASCC